MWMWNVSPRCNWIIDRPQRRTDILLHHPLQGYTLLFHAINSIRPMSNSPGRWNPMEPDGTRWNPVEPDGTRWNPVDHSIAFNFPLFSFASFPLMIIIIGWIFPSSPRRVILHQGKGRGGGKEGGDNNKDTHTHTHTHTQEEEEEEVKEREKISVTRTVQSPPSCSYNATPPTAYMIIFHLIPWQNETIPIEYQFKISTRNPSSAIER